MTYRITAEERASFKRCRRQWDFASPHRRDLEPVQRADQPWPDALKDALAVYYYPGTWDWPHQLTQSLVHKALDRAFEEAGTKEMLPTAAALVDCYDAWASTVDDFAPIRINHDVHGMVPDPQEPDRGLSPPEGIPVVYTAQIDLLAVDAADEYWVMRHQLIDEWQDVDTLLADEVALAGCWAWEQDYLGMEIAGTIHNEIRISGPLQMPTERETERVRAVAQHDPSGGGRSIPQHRRTYVRTSSPVSGDRILQRAAGPLRRTRIRRTREEITGVGVQLAHEALEMLGDPTVYPTPAEHCGACAFSGPCLAMMADRDPEPLLTKGFRKHPPESEQRPRLGQSTWGFGRGAAPPQW